MKKFKIPFVLVLVLFIRSCTERSSDDITNPPPNNSGGTEIEGDVSGLLSKANSPYKVMDTLFVDAQNSLTIEKGVRLTFTDSASFVIRGKLTAVGDANSIITFTAFSSRWRGIQILNSSQNSTFRFCIFEKVFVERQDTSGFGAIEINNSIATVQNCIFRKNSSFNGGGLSLLDDRSIITNNIIRENHTVVFGGGILASGSSAQIINNTFFDNLSENVGGGLVLVDPVSMDIQNNIFFENTGSYPFIHLAAGDTSGFNEQYNFIPIGNQDPRFISEENLHLLASSPCIDAGNPDPAFNDPDSSRNDQGAYGGPLGNW